MSENSLWEGIQAGNYCKSSILLHWDFCNFKHTDWQKKGKKGKNKEEDERERGCGN